jgi:SAM-dependent methyltransferase
MLVRHLLDVRPGAFRITACDRSPNMVQAVGERTAESGDVRLVIGNVENMPFPDASFDVVVAMGVLEYADADRGMRDVVRVLRPGGLLVLTMLNPQSPYRFCEWCLYWPGLRMLGRVERLLRVPEARRHGVPKSGIRAIRPARLRRMTRDAGLVPEDVLHYDVTPLFPPLDKVGRRWSRSWRSHPQKTVSRGVWRWLGTGYMVVARRAGEPASGGLSARTVKRSRSHAAADTTARAVQ